MNSLSPERFQTIFHKKNVATGLVKGADLVARHFFVVEKKMYFFDEIEEVTPDVFGYEILFSNNDSLHVDPVQFKQISDKLDNLLGDS